MDRYFVRDPSNMWKWEEVTIEEAFQHKEIRGFEQDPVDLKCFYALYDEDYKI